MITQLDSNSTGSYKMFTSSGSEYFIDTDKMILIRKPFSVSPTDNTWMRADLRKDGDVININTIERCIVGERAYFSLNGVNKLGADTFRVTTPIISIIET